MEELKKRLENKFGEKYYLVEICDDRDRCIVSDGKYEYYITTRNQLECGDIIHQKCMTRESFVKKLNEEIKTDEFVVTKFIIDGTNKRVEFLCVKTNKPYVVPFYYNTDALVRTMGLVCDRSKCFREGLFKKYGNSITFCSDDFKGVDKKINFTCADHGVFNSRPCRVIYHVYGCPTCALEKKKNFSYSSFERQCKNNVGYLYLLECIGHDESFIKIGITSHSDLSKRFNRKEYMPYSYSLLHRVESNPKTICLLEAECHSRLKEYSYKPELSFHGKTECFEIQIKDKAIQTIKEILLSLHIDNHK